MDEAALRSFFAWISVINMGILLYWFLMIVFAKDWVYKLHTRWYQLSREEFDSIHYRGLMHFKLMVFFFNLAPYFALRILAS